VGRISSRTNKARGGKRTDVDDEDEETLSLPAHLPTCERIFPHDLAITLLSPRSRDVFVEREPSDLVSERLDSRAFKNLGRGTGVGDGVKGTIEGDGRMEVGVEKGEIPSEVDGGRSAGQGDFERKDGRNGGRQSRKSERRLLQEVVESEKQAGVAHSD
jgi:hypothetical protein